MLRTTSVTAATRSGSGRLQFITLALAAAAFAVGCSSSDDSGGSCTKNADCAATEFCGLDATCHVNMCPSGFTCPTAGDVCDPTRGCVPSNATADGGMGGSGATGPTGPTGSGNSCANVTCNTGAGESCNPATGMCTSAEPAGACSLLTQDCADNGACALTDMGVACGPAGTATDGQACNQMTACAKGFLCVGNSPTTLTCRKICDRSMAGVCGASAGCGGIQLEDGSTLPRVGVCFETMGCNIFSQDCANGQGCYLYANVDAPACGPAGTVAPGGACGGSASMNCQKGSLCLTTMSGGASMSSCLKVCDTTVTPPTACDGTERCQAVNLGTNTPANMGVCVAGAAQ